MFHFLRNMQSREAVAQFRFDADLEHVCTLQPETLAEAG